MGFFARMFGATTLTDPGHVVSAYEPTEAKGVGFSTEFVRTVSDLYPSSAGDYGLLYRRQPAVRAVVQWLGRNVGQLNPKVFERVGDVDRIEVGDHPLARVLRAPNPTVTRFRHLRDTVQDAAIYDVAVWLKMPTATRFAVVRIPPKFLSTEVVDGRTLWVDSRNGSRYRRDQLVIFPGFSPDDDDLGVSPLETLRRVLAEEFASQQHRENMWRNSARQSGWIERPDGAPQWSDDARRRFRADLESVMSGGSNAGRIGILEEGMTWNPSSFSPKDTEYIEGRRLTYEEVCVEYGMTPSLLGMGGDTAASSESRHRQAYQDVLGPWLRMLQDEIELQLLPDLEPLNRRGTVYVEFNLAEKLKGSFEEQQKALTTAIGVPHLTINEGRARLNLPRIDEDWADVPVQPMNVLYGGQPAVTVPTEDPGTPAMASAEPQRKTLPPVDGAVFAEFLTDYFDRQERSGVASFGQKAAKSREKWDDELRGDLFTLAAKAVPGAPATWLNDYADATAKGLNDDLAREVGYAGSVEQVRTVFADARKCADELGHRIATELTDYAHAEAVRQTELGDG